MSVIQSILGRLHVLFLGFSASGWMVFVIGFGGQQLSLDPIINAVSFLFLPWWIATFVGPVMYILVAIDLLVGAQCRYKIAGIFRGTSFFFIVIYIAALAAPLFVVATLIASAAGGIQDVVDAIDIPDLSDFIGRRKIFSEVFDPIVDGIEEGVNQVVELIDRFLDLLIDFITGILYFILVTLFDQFLSGMKAQFTGSFLSIFWLGMSMMVRSCIKKKNKKEHKGLC